MNFVLEVVVILCAYGQVDLVTRFAAFKIATNEERKKPLGLPRNFIFLRPLEMGTLLLLLPDS